MGHCATPPPGPLTRFIVLISSRLEEKIRTLYECVRLRLTMFSVRSNGGNSGATGASSLLGQLQLFILDPPLLSVLLQTLTEEPTGNDSPTSPKSMHASKLKIAPFTPSQIYIT